MIDILKKGEITYEEKNNIIFQNPVSITAVAATTSYTTNDNIAKDNSDDNNPSATANGIQFNISDKDGKSDTLEIIPKITDADNSNSDLTSNFTIDIKEESGDNITRLSNKTTSTNNGGVLVQTVNTSKTDSSIGTSDFEPKYDVTIKPTSKDVANSIADKKLNITLTAQLSNSKQQ